MLTGDAQRARPPITLAGQRANGGAIPERAPSPPPNERPKWSGPPRGHGSRSIPDGEEPTAADGDGPYSYDELERMNREFIRAVERAFKRGKENRQAAAGTNTPRRRSARAL